MNDQTYLKLILIDQNCINSILTGYITLGSSQKKNSKVALSGESVRAKSRCNPENVTYAFSSVSNGIFNAVCCLKQYLTLNVS